MENKDFNNTSYTSRTERKKFEEELKNKQTQKEKELEEKRAELKNIIFNDGKKNVYKNPKKQRRQEFDNTKEEIKKPKAANMFLSLTYVITIAVFIYLTSQSFTWS